MTTKEFFPIEIFPIDLIRPIEQTARHHVDNLREEIEITGVWTVPLVIDRDHNMVMSGHHLYSAALAIGLGAVPVIRLHYDDPAVELKSWRPGEVLTPETIQARCRAGELLAPKSARHIIHVPLPSSRVPLSHLRTKDHVGEMVAPAVPHPSRAQILANDYHAFGERMGVRTDSVAKLDLDTATTLVPHTHLRQMLEADPAMQALLPAAPCRIALGQTEDAPFRLKGAELLLVPPTLLGNSAALAAAARWGMEAAFAVQAGSEPERRLAALVRHGAALVRQLPSNDRAMLMSVLPDGIPELLTGLREQPCAPALLAWMAERVGVAGAVGEAGAHPEAGAEGARGVSLEMPVEAVLVSNGDSRLAVDPTTGKNRYGTVARPRPEAVHFSSSTASSISDYGFLFCDILRRDLLSHMMDAEHGAHTTHAALADAIVGELRQMCGLEAAEADGVIAPSGTDTELLAVLMARGAAPGLKLTNILISPEETGRGVKLAGAGRFFDPQSATGTPVEMNGDVWPGAEIEIIDIPIRADDGTRMPAAALDDAFLSAGRAALEQPGRVLAHKLIGSKTGLDGPSDAAIDRLVALDPARVDVVVDACQMRVDYLTLGGYLRRGWMVQVSGSKSLTGPPFSGALLIPTDLRARKDMVGALLHPGIGYAEDWSAAWVPHLPKTPGDPAFGAGFRWLPALLEAKLLRRVPSALREHVLSRFCDVVTDRLNQSACFHCLPRAHDGGEDPSEQQFARHSIISFEILARNWDGARLSLDEPQCRKIFELLNSDASQLMPEASQPIRSVLSQQFHIGQPVVLGKGENRRVVLRLVIGMRFFNIVGHAGPGGIPAALESEISDLVRAIDKLEIIAENWWKLCDDI